MQVRRLLHIQRAQRSTTPSSLMRTGEFSGFTAGRLPVSFSLSPMRIHGRLHTWYVYKATYLSSQFKRSCSNSTTPLQSATGSLGLPSTAVWFSDSAGLWGRDGIPRDPKLHWGCVFVGHLYTAVRAPECLGKTPANCLNLLTCQRSREDFAWNLFARSRPSRA